MHAFLLNRKKSGEDTGKGPNYKSWLGKVVFSLSVQGPGPGRLEGLLGCSLGPSMHRVRFCLFSSSVGLCVRCSDLSRRAQPGQLCAYALASSSTTRTTDQDPPPHCQVGGLHDIHAVCGQVYLKLFVREPALHPSHLPDDAE